MLIQPTYQDQIAVQELTPEQKLKLRKYYAAFPDKWLKAHTGEEVWWKQQEIMRAVAVERRVAVASCNSAGKSFLSSRLALWFLSVYTPATVITTAPTNRQVEEVLWREIRRGYMLAKYRGEDLGPEPLTTKWNLGIEQYAIGFAPRDYNPTAFQGYHNVHMLVIVDEAAGVTDDVFKGVDSVVRGADYHILYIGNPTNITGRFYNAFKTPGWWTTRISAFQSPNVIAKESIVPGVVNYQDIIDAEREYGRESWEWRVWIEGKFPDKEADTLIALDWTANAFKRDITQEQYIQQTEVGADIARFGSDSSVFIAQRGFHVFHGVQHFKKDTMQAVSLLCEFVEKVKAKVVRIDSIGVGAGVLDRFREVAPKTIRIVEMIGNEKALNPLRYANAVTEWWDHLAGLLKTGAASGPLFGNKALVGDLVSRKAKMLSNSIMQLESKADLKKRIHRSPDWGDAVVMACATKIEGNSRKRIKGAPMYDLEQRPLGIG